MLSGSGESSTGEKPRQRTVKKREKRIEDLVYRRLTFRRGYVPTARFAPDGSVVYGAAWEDRPFEVFTSYPGNPDARPLALANADVMAISRSGDLAVSLGREFVAGWISTGTLARMPLTGGVPRELCEGAQDADWAPDGKNFAIIRRSGDEFQLEYPIGHPIYVSPTWISNVRFSPKGDRIAYLEHPFWGDDAGRVIISDLKGNRITEMDRVSASTGGLAWAPKGDEVWFAAVRVGRVGMEISALSVSGKERLVFHGPSRLGLHDISPQGDVLVSFNDGRREILSGTRSGNEERNLTWFDWPFLSGISDDGTRIVFEEWGAAKRGSLSAIYVRATDGSPAVYIGDGRARGISPDGRWIAAATGSDGFFELLPTGAGESRMISHAPLEKARWWSWFRDGTRLLVWGLEASGATRLYELPLDGSPAEPIGPEGVEFQYALSPDGTRVAALSRDRLPNLYTKGSEVAEPIPSAQIGDQPIHWTSDGRSIIVFRRGRYRVSLEQIDLASGKRTLWKELRPSDPAGILDILPIAISANDETYAYGFRRMLSDLYIVSGLI